MTIKRELPANEPRKNFEEMPPQVQFDDLGQRILDLPSRGSNSSKTHYVRFKYDQTAHRPEMFVAFSLFYDSEERNKLEAIGAEWHINVSDHAWNHDWRQLEWHYTEAENLNSGEAREALQLINQSLEFTEESIALSSNGNVMNMRLSESSIRNSYQ